MSTKLFFQDDSIQLIEISSNNGSTENIRSPNKILNKLKKNNRIHSPISQQPSINSSTSTISDISNVFAARKTPDENFKSPTNISETRTYNKNRRSETPSDKQSIFSMKSETFSYKNKLRNRFLSIKKQAGGEISNEVNKTPKLKTIENPALANENSIINQELEKHQRIKSKWGLLKTTSSFDFFCNEIQEISENSGRKNSEHVEVDIERVSSSHQSLIDLLNEELFEDVVEYLPAESIDVSLNEKDLLWTPKSENVFIDKSVSMENLEDDGLYKETKCKIPNNELLLLEKRLHTENSELWFNSNGELKILPDPRLRKSYKPFKSSLNHRDFVNEYKRPDLYQIAELSEQKLLEFTLYEISFTHHPLFSLEHMLVGQLKSHYNQYLERMKHNNFIRLQKKLDALKCAKHLLENNASNKDLSNFQKDRLRKYISEIKVTRGNMLLEGKTDRDITKTILCLWKLIKKTREVQKHSNTSSKLIITKEHGNYEKEMEIWETNLSDHLSELIKVQQDMYETKLQNYKCKLKEWKSLKKSMIYDDDYPEKPEKPQKDFDVEEMRSAILQIYQNSLKPPGEPSIEFDLQETQEIAEDVDHTPEKIRRQALNRTQIYTKIVFNNQEICKSKLVALPKNFICRFNQNIAIQFFQIPNNLTLEIYEQSGMISRNILGEISLKIPEFHCDFNSAKITTENFKRNIKIEYSHTGIGSGISIKEVLKKFNLQGEYPGIADTILYTSGTISYTSGWNIPEQNHQQVSILKSELMHENLQNIDPQNPNNATYLEMAQNLDICEEKKYFRLNPELNPLQFCGSESIESNLRFKLLVLRNNNEPEFQNMVVPNRLKEIPEDIFTSYEKRVKNEQVRSSLENSESDGIDEFREKNRKHYQNIENRIIQMSKASEKTITKKDVLKEEAVPTIGTLGLTFMKWLQPKRPLRPERKSPSELPLLLTKSEPKIIANIISAMQIPLRKDLDNPMVLPNNDSFNMVSLRPFVIVTFGDISLKTTVSEGPNPIWNQELIFPLPNPNGNFHNLKDTLYIHLFDEVVIDVLEDDRLRETNIQKQFKRNWLGGLAIPFSTLYHNNRIEGTFKLNTPSIIIGYDYPVTNVNPNNILQRNDMYLTLFLTLQPSTVLQKQIKNVLKSNEMPYIEDHIIEWEKNYCSNFPNRQFTTLVTNANGEKTCVVHYLRPIKPPNLVEDIEDTGIKAGQCAKYVSVIPFWNPPLLTNAPQIWLSAEQLLTLCIGSIQDHAVLLTCYFMSLDLNSWLLIGHGIPHGPSVYVLIQENNNNKDEYYIFDVENAQKYSINDNYCPVQRVFCLTNNENVWANIQTDDRLHLTKFNVSRQSDWLPLFRQGITIPVYSNPSAIAYNRTPSVGTLQQNIENKLKKKFMKYRKHTRTIWNHYCNATLKEILPKLEKSYMEQTGYFYNQEHLMDLRNFTNSYNMYGFALNFPYTSIRKIVEFIRLLGIHEDVNSDAEFSLAVHVEDYPNSVLRVWIYILSLIRKQ